MYKKTKIVSKHIQRILLGFSISFILSSLVSVNADTQTAKDSDVEYKGYDVPIDPEGRRYHRFLQFPAPQGASYDTRKKAIANIDDTPEKETIVLMVAEAGEEWRQWCQAFLLIAGAETEANELLQKKNSSNFLMLVPMILMSRGKTLKFGTHPSSLGNRGVVSLGLSSGLGLNSWI